MLSRQCCRAYEARSLSATYFALFHDDPGVLTDWRTRIERYLEGRRLRLHPRKTVILQTSAPAEFLGFVLLGDGRRRLPEDNVTRFRGRLRGLSDRSRAGTVEAGDVDARIRSCQAHADHANTWRLQRAILGDDRVKFGRSKVGYDTFEP